MLQVPTQTPEFVPSSYHISEQSARKLRLLLRREHGLLGCAGHCWAMCSPAVHRPLFALVHIASSFLTLTQPRRTSSPGTSAPSCSVRSQHPIYPDVFFPRKTRLVRSTSRLLRHDRIPSSPSTAVNSTSLGPRNLLNHRGRRSCRMHLGKG
ncbi:hypothetical protein C8R46DRAFT_36930 [Mycena filopes]|nr:hypothetical protein C8R46DRAFT_36930 [Mycena filopes]